MTIKKGDAFLVAEGAILFVHITTLNAYRGLADPAPFVGAVLTSIVAVASMFIVGNVADNGVKGKFFNAGLQDGKGA